jgi:hypothetical protein
MRRGNLFPTRVAIPEQGVRKRTFRPRLGLRLPFDPSVLTGSHIVSTTSASGCRRRSVAGPLLYPHEKPGPGRLPQP